jgi:hypothetical protein
LVFLSKAPWWGGQYERLVGLVKQSLYLDRSVALEVERARGSRVRREDQLKQQTSYERRSTNFEHQPVTLKVSILLIFGLLEGITK